LRGKDKPDWQPHIDSGDMVNITNVDKIVVTGNKMHDKMYYRHSQYPGGLKEEKLSHLIERKGHEEAVKLAIYNMLPKNRLRQHMMKRLQFSKES